MKRVLSWGSVVLVACLLLPAWSQSAWQFTADEAVVSEETVVWASKNNEWILASVHPPSNGWHLAMHDGERVVFTGGGTSPLGFPDTASNTVSHLFAVVSCMMPETHATLLDAPCSIRFMPDWFHDGNARFYASQLDACLTLAVNGISTPHFSESASLQLIEAVFEPPVPLHALCIGGTPATPAWGQSWDGKVAELVFLGECPSDRESNAIRRYLSLKQGIGVPTDSDSEIVSVLTRLGLDTAGLFNAVLMVR